MQLRVASMLLALAVGGSGLAAATGDILIPALRKPTANEKLIRPWEREVHFTSNPDTVADCRLLGPVKRSVNMGGWFQGVGKDKAEKALQLNVWQSFGDTVFITYIDGGYWKNQEISGEAYRCQPVTDQRFFDAMEHRLQLARDGMDYYMAKIKRLREEYEKAPSDEVYSQLEECVAKYRVAEEAATRAEEELAAARGESDGAPDPLLVFDKATPAGPGDPKDDRTDGRIN